VLAAVALASAACNLVDAPLGGLTLRPADAGARDTGPDAPAPIDAALDAPGLVPDDAGLDAGLDSGLDAALDAGLDAGIDSGPPPSCDDIYGDAEGYVRCEETEAECWFSADTPTNCDDVCEEWGGECLDAWDNPNEKGEECDHAEQPDADDCESEGRSTQLCVCTR
jgi:hypothetical protein